MTKKKRTFESYIQTIAIVVFAFALLGWLIFTVYLTFWGPEEKDTTIKFEVTGVLNSENASTLVQIHYECIKYCIDEYGHYGKSADDCWKECALLGKEGCDGK